MFADRQVNMFDVNLNKKLIILLAGFTSLFTALQVSSNTQLRTSGSASLQITGTIMLPPPCTVNNDKPVTVEFDNVRTDLIDGLNYDMRAIPVAIACTDTPSGKLVLSLQGTAASSSSSTLLTSVPNLGIRIRRDNADFLLNNWVDVYNGDSFTLMAVPTKLTSAPVSTGEFTASATLVIIQE